MPEVRFNLLEEPLLGIAVKRGEISTDLPSVLEALGHEDSVEFSALQAHQQQGWYAFLVQLAAIALHAGGATGPAQPAVEWRRLLRSLTGGKDEAWCLVVEDLSQPAFMQTPVPEGTLDGFKSGCGSPSEIDVLVTSKNHDVKSRRIALPRGEHWVYGLVTLQTMQGFLGRGNYGIARMNGGFGSRASVAFAPGPDWGIRFRRDVAALLEARDVLVDQYGFVAAEGAALLWLLPWDGSESLALTDCDPFFIEICRRIRAVSSNEVINMRTAPSQSARIDAKERLGDVGDPWIPVAKESGKALTVSNAGLGYRLTRDLLFGGDWSHGVAAGIREEDGETPTFTATVLVRGQGETSGLRNRALRIPRPVRSMLSSSTGRAHLDAVSRAHVEAAVEIQRHVLYPALRQLFEDAPADAALARAWVSHHDAAVDRVFFENLWKHVGDDDGRGVLQWQHTLLALARGTLGEAIRSAPLRSARRYRSIANSERMFDHLARKHVEDLDRVQEPTE